MFPPPPHGGSGGAVPNLSGHEPHQPGPDHRRGRSELGPAVVSTAYAPGDWVNFGLAAAGAAALLFGLVNTWVLLVEILR
jgi:hypothetical protein